MRVRVLVCVCVCGRVWVRVGVLQVPATPVACALHLELRALLALVDAGLLCQVAEIARLGAECKCLGEGEARNASLGCVAYFEISGMAL